MSNRQQAALGSVSMVCGILLLGRDSPEVFSMWFFALGLLGVVMFVLGFFMAVLAL